MPNKKPISKYLGIGRGAFRKAFISVLLDSYSEDDAFEVCLKEFGENCIYCGVGNDNNQLQADFLWIQAEGGLLKKGNVVPACPTCNSGRGQKDWEKFIRETKSIANKDYKIKKIKEYMKKYGMDEKPDIQEYIDKNKFEVLDDLNLLLDALTQGLRMKINNPQQKNVKFDRPGEMFDELVKITKKYRKMQN